VHAILLIDHGSRREAANAVVFAVADMVRAAHGSTIVEVAHLELASPTIAEGFAACVAAGARTVVAVPYFLGPGRHVREDVPRLVREAAESHEGVTARVTEPFGADPLIAELVARRAGLTGQSAKT